MSEEPLAREDIVLMANGHLDQLVEMVRYKVAQDPTFDAHELVDILQDPVPGVRLEDHLCTVSYNLALAIFRLAQHHE